MGGLKENSLSAYRYLVTSEYNLIYGIRFNMNEYKNQQILITGILMYNVLTI